MRQPSLSDPRVLLLPSHVVTDLALYYTPSNKLALTFKVGNLFNKTYFEGVNSTTNSNDHVYTTEIQGQTQLTLTGDYNTGYAATAALYLPITKEY